jgi:hypothetical protein
MIPLGAPSSRRRASPGKPVRAGPRREAERPRYQASRGRSGGKVVRLV